MYLQGWASNLESSKARPSNSRHPSRPRFPFPIPIPSSSRLLLVPPAAAVLCLDVSPSPHRTSTLTSQRPSRGVQVGPGLSPKEDDVSEAGLPRWCLRHTPKTPSPHLTLFCAHETHKGSLCCLARPESTCQRHLATSPPPALCAATTRLQHASYPRPADNTAPCHCAHPRATLLSHFHCSCTTRNVPSLHSAASICPTPSTP